MIRTLLGMTGKASFDAAVRSARKEAEYDRLQSFVRDFLVPALAGDGGRMDKVPDLPAIIEDALAGPRSRGASAFRKLGTGRVYRGDAMAMIRDVAPGLVPKYVEATREMTELDTLSSFIQSRSGDVGKERIDGAMRCLEPFPGWSAEDGGGGSEDEGDLICPKATGMECERLCAQYLRDGMEADEILLTNVLVNHLSARSRPKYHSSRSARSGKAASGGIIWSSIARANICSEFDAVLYANDGSGGEEPGTARIREIWEAKYCISPAALWDAMTKKAVAIREILNDDEAYLSSHREEMRLGKTEDGRAVFGIFGKELLSPENAVAQMRATATSKEVTRYPEAVVKALDCGYIEVKREKVLRDLDLIRERLRDTEKDFLVSLIVH